MKDKKVLTEEQKKRKHKIRITILITCFSFLIIVGIVLTSFMMYGQSQMKKIPGMSFKDCLTYTLGGNKEGIITIGIIKNGEVSYTVYGEDGKELPKELHTYEIGSLTKTFTAALIQKAVDAGKIKLDDTIDKYLSLSGKNGYPTIKQLLTHTSGYKGYYFAFPMIGNFFTGRNDFCGITDDMVLNKLKSLNTKKQDYSFKYSNYGYAVLGLVLEKVYGEEYTVLANNFATELGLLSTHISDGNGDLENYWDWQDNDAYMSAGALTSNIEDMLKYAQLQLDGSGVFGKCHRVIKEIDATTEKNELMGIRMDSVGMAWITDEENGIVWHNGGTGDYNCYLGFCPENGTAVVILSNLAPDYRIPATVMGVKLLQNK